MDTALKNRRILSDFVEFADSVGGMAPMLVIDIIDRLGGFENFIKNAVDLSENYRESGCTGLDSRHTTMAIYKKHSDAIHDYFEKVVEKTSAPRGYKDIQWLAITLSGSFTKRDLLIAHYTSNLMFNEEHGLTIDDCLLIQMLDDTSNQHYATYAHGAVITACEELAYIHETYLDENAD